jgi:hypothetical protein
MTSFILQIYICLMLFLTQISTSEIFIKFDMNETIYLKLHLNYNNYFDDSQGYIIKSTLCDINFTNGTTFGENDNEICEGKVYSYSIHIDFYI